MYEIDTKDLKRAKENDNEALTRIININSRAFMEHYKKIFRKRI